MPNLHIYSGPSVHAQDPVILARGEAQGDGSLPGSAAALRALLPMLPESRLDAVLAEAARQPLPRLAALGALAAELQNHHGGMVLSHGVSRDAKGAVAYVGYHERGVATLAVGAAWLAVCAPRGTIDGGGALPEVLGRLEARCKTHQPGYVVNRVALRLARERSIPLRQHFPGSGILQFGTGAHAAFYQSSMSEADSWIGVSLVHNKFLANALVAQLGLPRPKQAAAMTRGEVAEAARRVGYPCVVKPSDSSQGKGVTVRVAGEAAALAAFDLARSYSRAPVVIERFIEGRDFRLLVIGGRLAAAARRDPPSATGDGRSTLRRLVEAINEARAHPAPGDDRGLFPVPMDADLELWAAEQGFGLDDVVPPGRVVRLRGAANNHGGAVPVDVLAQVHPDVRAMAEMLARTVGIHALGIDYVSADIGRSWREVPSAVIELNQSPGLFVHQSAGTPTVPLAEAILAPVLAAAGRIPVVVVLEQPPAPAATALAARLVARPGVAGLGILLHGSAALGGTALDLDGRSLPAKVEALLCNRSCAAALIACTPDDLLGTGFPVDRCDMVVLPGTLGIDPELRALAGRCAAKLVEADAGSLEAASACLEAGLRSFQDR